jgi:hypothetical protein
MGLPPFSDTQSQVSPKILIIVFFFSTGKQPGIRPKFHGKAELRIGMILGSPG